MIHANTGYIAPVFLAVAIVALALSPTIERSDASSKSPYESGYDHGCDDADISDPGDRYINQPGKGPDFHTNEFMRGYNDGYDECSGGGDSNGSEGGRNEDRGGSSGGGIEDDIRDTCIDLLNMSPERCQDLIDTGKVWLICRGLNAIGIPVFFC